MIHVEDHACLGFLSMFNYTFKENEPIHRTGSSR